MPFIEVIEPGEATGMLKKIYIYLQKSRGKLAMVHKIQSLNPESITTHMDLLYAGDVWTVPAKKSSERNDSRGGFGGKPV